MTKYLTIFFVLVAGANPASAKPVSVSPAAAHPKESSFKLTEGSVTFLATGKPGFLRINGEGGRPIGHFIMDLAHTKVTSGDVTVHLDAFETGLSTRDRHMKEKYLETKKFPDAIFTATALNFKNGKLPGETDLHGTLTLHGMTKPVTAKVKVTPQNNTFAIEADFEIVLSEFSIKIPEYAGITVAEKVKVHTTFTAKASNP